MKQRIFGKTGKLVSEIGLGTWQLGPKWGDPFNREEEFRILEMAEEARKPSVSPVSLRFSEGWRYHSCYAPRYSLREARVSDGNPLVCSSSASLLSAL